MSTFAVLGLGPSLSAYTGREGKSIGVNDIWQFVKSDYVVCVDPPSKFTRERLRTISDCSPDIFFSHLSAWSFKPCFQKIHLMHERGIVDFNSDRITYGIISPICAIHLALTLGATSIDIYGVDIIEHPVLKKKVKVVLKQLQGVIDACPVRIDLHSPLREYLQL